MNFDEGLEMEERISEDVRKILMRYPEAAHVQCYSGQGRRKYRLDGLGIFDVLGLDAIIFLRNNKELKVQVKCGSAENFEKWGKVRQSFQLGDANDLEWLKVKDTPIKFYDLMLTGYEISPGILSPYTLFSWPFFIKRIHNGTYRVGDVGEIDEKKICISRNLEDNHLFAWARWERFVDESLNLTKQFNIRLFDPQI